MNQSLRMLIAKAAIVTAGTCALVASVSAAEVVIVAPGAPPAARYEAVPAARDGYVWDRGHWKWEHGQYAWAPGHWQPVRVGYHWVPGHWVARGPNSHWVEGHWA